MSMMLTQFRLMIVALMLCVVSVGCGLEEKGIPKTGYGKTGDSLNGTKVFAQLLRERGHYVGHRTRISPRLHRFDTIVWFPDRDRSPKVESVIWLEDWLAEDGRTLVIVGRGYQADLDYWTQMVSMTEGPTQEKSRRHRAESMISGRRSESIFVGLNDDDVDGLWYEEEVHDLTSTNEFTGPWSVGIDASKTTIECRKLFSPPTTLNDPDIVDEHEFTMWGFRSFDLETKVLLAVDGEPFAFQIDADDVDSKLIVVSNASFLLNYPLLIPENRKLAMRVAEQCDGDVVFLETGRMGAAISTGEDNHGTWAWITKKPMNYLVPHLLMWGILFCFVYFPIFGRPKRLNFSPEKKFKNHVNAVGEMLRKSGDQTWAKNKIAEFQKIAGRRKK
jgi:hypothetical protein